MTRVSIVTISYNQAEFLERTLLSVLNQNYPGIEYIVVDPGSTDGSRDIIERYRSRIAKVVYEPDRGAADGLNHGFAEAGGSIYAYLNSDDLLLPGAVLSAVKYLDQNPDIAVVSGHGHLIGPKDQFLRRLYSDRMSAHRALYGGATLIQPSTFFRKEVFHLAGGFSVENRICWDSELFLEMALRGANFAIVDEFWSAFRVHSQSTSNSKAILFKIRKMQEDIFFRVKGRRERGIDRAMVSGHRMLRRFLNPRDSWERLVRGPVGGRVFDR